MDWQERISTDPAVLTGKPVVKGTRLAVAFIIDLLAQGWGEQDILANYPGLTATDIRACLAYASAILGDEMHICMPRESTLTVLREHHKGTDHE